MFRMIAVMAALVTAGAASAQTATDYEALHQAVLTNCAADQKKFCDGKTGREGHECMAANLPNASAECRAAIARMPQRPAPVGDHKDQPGSVPGNG